MQTIRLPQQLSGSILNSGWLDWVLIRFITFDEIGLPINSDDRAVGRLAQYVVKCYLIIDKIVIS